MTAKWPWLWLLFLVGIGCAGPAKTAVNMREQAISLNDAGYQYYRQSRWTLAQEKFSQALKYNRLIDNRPGIAANLNNLGAIAQEQGDLAQARQDFQEALTIYREGGDRMGIIEALNNLGTVYQAQGNLKEAEAAYRQAESLVRSEPPGPLASLTLMHLGDAARARGDYQYALSLYGQALALDQQRQDRRGEAVRWQRMGRTYLDLQDYGQAANYLHRSLEEFRRLQDTNGIVDSLKGLTDLALAQGDRAAALVYGERLLKIYQARGQSEEARKLEAALKTGGGAPSRR